MRTIKESEVALLYQYENGNLYRLLKYGVRQSVGTIDYVGYRRIKRNKQYFFAHRIIYIMFKGEIPKGMHIDHINGIKSDNRIENLRLATISENISNVKHRQPNKTGFTGVYQNRTGGKYYAAVQKDNKTYRSKSFDTKEAAYEHYKTESKRLFGEFSIYNVTHKNKVF